MEKGVTFGSKLRSLRYKEGLGIKRLAPELGLDYTYLSRLENDKLLPSTDVVERISKYFDHDRDELMLLADKIPEDIRRILRENPQEALEFLRNRFAGNERVGSR